MVYVFADCELDTQLYVLRRTNRTIAIRPKVFQVLLYLLEHRGHVVSKHELLEAVWPEQYISDATLADVIRTIRQAVGDQARQSQVIRTRHGHGYRFVAEVTSLPPPRTDMPVPEALASAPGAPAPPLPGNLPQVAGERKVVTMLCVTLGQSAALLEQLGLDALYTLMHTRYDLVTQVVQPYEGMLQPLLGDRVLVAFGLPRTQEDHARRAGLAALAVRERLEAHRQTSAAACQAALAVRIGLHTGWVAVGGTEQTSEGASMVIGDAVSLAMTLQDQAEPGMILCSEATAQRLQEVAPVKEYRLLALPGQLTPVMAYTLLAPRTVSRPRELGRALSPFVGRGRELATLQALLAQVCAGQGQVVCLVGEPGIGKSRLLAEWRSRQRRQPLAYVESQCLSYGTTSPYLPLRPLLRQLCAIAEAENAETVARKVCQRLQEVQLPPEVWAAPLLDLLLGSAFSPMPLAALSPQERKERTFAALLQLCVHSSQHCPLVLEIENLHWLDATSEAWLAALVEHVAGRPILLLGSCRPGYHPAWLGASYVTQLSLARLTPRESLRMLQAVPQAAQFSEALTQEVLAKAAGNPFFLEELTQAVVERSTDHLGTIPDTVQAVLAARIDRLTPIAKHLLQVAAVIGKEVPLPLLAGVTTLPPMALQQGLHHLQQAELLYETRVVPTPTYAFKHILTQEVAYQSLLGGTRQPYHQQIAQMLTAHFPETVALHPEHLAHHYTEAGLFEQALPYWQRAGAEAVARSANVEAISHFTKGLEVLRRLPVTPQRNRDELTLQLALSTPLFVRQQMQAVGDISQRVLELSQELGDNVQYFAGLAGLWRFFFNTGQLHKARQMGQQCLALARHAQDPVLLPEAHMMLGSICLGLGELLTARSHFQHSVPFYVARPVQARSVGQVVDPGVVCLCREAWTLWLLGYADQALAASNQALTLARATAHAFSLTFALFHAGVIHKCRQEMGAALEYVEAAIVLAREHDFPYYVSIGRCLQDSCLAEQGASVDLTRLLEAVAAWTGSGEKYGFGAFYVSLARIYYACGQIDAGLQVLDEALTTIDTMTVRFYEAEGYRTRGIFLLHPEALDVRQAEACFQRACAIAAHQHAKAWELRSTVSLSRLWHQQGKHLAARQRLEHIYGWFTEGFETLDLREAQALLDMLAR